MRTITLLLMTLLPAVVVAAPDAPVRGYAPVNGLRMYYEVHGTGEPVVLLHGAFMTITSNWNGWIDDLAATRTVIAIEMQGHGRTADITRDMSAAHFADDVAALLDHLGIARADIIGYSMGGTVAMQCAIRHPDRVRKVVVMSSTLRRDGVTEEGRVALATLSPELFRNSPLEAEYRALSPTPNDFPTLVDRLVAAMAQAQELTTDQLMASKAPMFFIFGDADGIRLDHVAEMFRSKGGEVHGDLRPRSASRLAILPDTTHVTLMARREVIVLMVNDFLDAAPSPPD